MSGTFSSGGTRPDKATQIIAAEDIGAFVALAFANPKEYLGKTLELAGDDELPSLESDFSETLKLLNALTENELKTIRISKETIRRIAEFRKNYNKENINAEPEIPPFEFDPIYDND